MDIELTELQKAVVYQQGAMLCTLNAMKEVTPAIKFNMFLKAFTKDTLDKLVETAATDRIDNNGK